MTPLLPSTTAGNLQAPFLPSPMATATAMYHTGVNTLHGVRRGGSQKVETVRGGRQRRLHKAFLRYHDSENWPLLRDALKSMGRADLIGPRQNQLVPAYQPVGTGQGGDKKRPSRPNSRPMKFTTKGVPFPKK